MAVPTISGPRAIGVVISILERVQGWTVYSGCLIGIVLFGILLYLCLALGEPLIRVMGKTVLGQ